MHKCAAKKCDARIRLHLLMCRKHWFMVPKPLRDAIWAAYKPGQEHDGSGLENDDYLEAVRAAVAAIAEAETPAQGDLFG